MRLALDPGVTTGVAWRQATGEIHATQWPGETIVVILDGFHAGYGLTEIVIENFRSRPGPAVNLSAPEAIGRVLAWADERGIPVVRQDASPVKRVITADRLRALGGWKRGEEHSRDATRHLLYREHRLGLVGW
jgi:hypothetical protein